MSLSVQALLLAAGSSRRFGSDKRFSPLANGVPLILQALNNLRAVIPRIVIVVKPGETPRFSQLIVTPQSVDISIIEAENASSGMGASLASGIRHIDSDAVLVALADMPFIQPASIRQVRNTLQQHALVVPTYRGKSGHPVGFQREYFAELAALSNEQGGKNILQRYSHKLTCVAVEDPGVLLDIDKPADLPA